MENKVLFTIPMFRGYKNGQTLIYTNFKQALDGLQRENLFFVEYFADLNFSRRKCRQVMRKDKKRFYLAEIKSYEELRYRALNDKWLTVPKDFLYDAKYRHEQFLFSAKARIISEFYDGDAFLLKEEYINTLKKKRKLSLTIEEQRLNKKISVQADIEFSVGNGLEYQPMEEGNDLDNALRKLKYYSEDFISLKGKQIVYRFDATVYTKRCFYIFAEEDKISLSEALEKSHWSPEIQKAAAQGIENFIYNQKKDTVIAVKNAYFVPRNILTHSWNLSEQKFEA